MGDRQMVVPSGNRVQESNPVLDYVRTLVDPKNNIARVPDGYDRATAVFRSISSFSIPISTDAYNKGRFSFCVQPKFGDLSDPTHYHAAIANPGNVTALTTTWDQIAWSAPGSYIGYNTTNAMGSDPRVDENAVYLTTQAPSFYGVNFGGANLTAGILVDPLPASMTILPDSTAPTINFYTPASPGNIGPLTEGVILLPYGDWNVNITAKFQINGTDTFEAINIGSSTFLGGVTVIGITQNSTPTPSSATTYVVTASVQVASSPGHQQLALVIASVQNGIGGAVAPSAHVTQVSATYLNITSANFTSSSVYSDGGVVQEVRPVSMAVLVTYMGTLLNDGGEISMCYVPYKTISNNYFATNNAGVGQLQLFENLRSIPEAYNGPIKDGAYGIWAPYTGDDNSLVAPGTMNATQYPGIICSGVFSPDATVGATQQTMRVMLYTTYEFVTTTTLFETQKLIGSQNMVDQAHGAIKRMTFCCANKSHENFITRAISGVRDFYGKNSSWINPMAAGLLTAL